MADDLNAMLKTRGLQEGGEPDVTDFIGTCVKFSTEQVTTNNRNRLQVTLDCGDIEVKESRIPWVHPTFSPRINYSERGRSGWGFLMKSIYEALGGEEAVMERLGGPEADTSFAAIFAAFIEGNRFEFKYFPESFGEDRDTGQERFWGCWHMYAVEGESPSAAAEEDVSPDEIALQILNGKNLQQFNAEVVTNPKLKDTDTLKAIMKKTWIASMMTAKRVTKDAKTGVFSVVE